MSNIVVYTTTKLKESEDFLNNFLDGLLEQYCSTKFVENTVIDSSISLPTLDDLIRFANPGYYYKFPGLYAHIHSTDVKLVYESYLHTELKKALAHKLSRLFVSYTVDKVSKLSIVCNHPSYYLDSLGSPRVSMRNHKYKISNQNPLKEISSFFDYYQKELKPFSTISFELYSFIDKTFNSDYELRYNSNFFRLYKPKSELLHQVIASVQQENEAYLEKMLNSFKEGNKKGISFWLAITFVTQNTSVYGMISQSVSSEFLERMKLYSEHLLNTDLSHVINSTILIGNEILNKAKQELLTYTQTEVNDKCVDVLEGDDKASNTFSACVSMAIIFILTLAGYFIFR